MSEGFKKKCPLCKKYLLTISSASCGISTFVDANKPKTFGAVSQQNIARKEKETGKEFGPKKPFWRSKKQVDFKILKDPKSYIEKGII